MKAASHACCSIDSPPAPAGEIDCPQCGQRGRRVATRTLKHIVQPEFLEMVSKPGFLFCRSSDCDVVYFHPDGDCLRKPDVRVRVGLKECEDPVPICYCFGFTKVTVVEEIRATGKCTILERITAEVKAGNCACEFRNPQGSCCLGNVNTAILRAMQTTSVEPW